MQYLDRDILIVRVNIKHTWLQTKGLQVHQRDTLKTVEHFAHLYRSENLGLPLHQIRVSPE